MTSTILITGASGGMGRHLSAYLRRSRSSTLIGLARRHAASGDLDALIPCDLTSAEQTARVVREVAPDLVFHLAGLNGFAPADELERVNVGGFVHLTAALRSLGKPVRMITVGSAAEIGPAGAARSPVAENVPCRPATAYGRSKWRVTELALGEPAESGLSILVARPFNLLGPGLDPQLAFGSFAEQLVAISRGQASALRCGRLDTRRDFIDVRDAVRALVLLAERGRPGEIYHVCAGRSWAIGDLLHTMLELSGLQVNLLGDPARAQAADIPDIYGDPTRLRLATGWSPQLSLEESLADMLGSASVLRRAA